MTPADANFLFRLDLAISREEGRDWILGNTAGLSDELAEALVDRKTELLAAGEKELAEDFSAWAAEIRSLVTRRLGSETKSEEDGLEFLRSHRDRFDEAYFDLSYRIADDVRNKLSALVEAAADRQLDDAAVKEAVETAEREAQTMAALARFVGDARNQAKAALLEGTILLHRVRWENQRGRTDAAAKLSGRAAEVLQSAAASSALDPDLRALGEMRLAALAGPAQPEALAQHQKSALSFALAGHAWELVQIVRRDQAYWAKERGDWRTAWELYCENIELTERLLFAARVPGQSVDLQTRAREDYEGAVETALECAKTDPTFYERALESAEQGKARAFLRGLATSANALGLVPPKLEERRKRILERMSVLSDNVREAAALSQALKTTEEQIWRHSRTIAIDLQCVPCTYEQMRALVPQGGVMLSYFTFSDRILIFVLDERGLATPPTEVKIDYDLLARWTVEFEVMIRGRGNYELTDAVQRKLDMAIPAFNADLYLRNFHQTFFEPVAAQLAGKRLVIIVPHRILCRLPFQAMVDAGGRAVVDDHPIEYTISLSVLRWGQDHARTGLNSCFAAGVCQLAGGPAQAQEEAAAVARIFGVEPSPATCAAVRGEAGKSDVIHLSCHSDLTAAATAFAGLQLEDGRLIQREIAMLRCQASLVTLSACTTARSDLLGRQGTEFAGLIGAFFRAGCPSVIASLWPAADKVAVPFAEALYRALKQDGMDKAEALRQAQLAIKARADEGYDHPYFWAPFGLWGNR